MAWGNLADNQMVSYTDAQGGGFILNSGQTAVTSNQCMTKNDALTKYNLNPTNMSSYGDLQLVPKSAWNTNVTWNASFNDSVYSISVQTDGKIVAGGSFTIYNTVSKPLLARLNSNTTLDTVFTTSAGGLFPAVVKTYIQTDSKILIGGHYTTINSVTQQFFTRLLSDGNIDSTFITNMGLGFERGTGSIAWGVFAIDVDSNNKIYVGGDFIKFNGSTQNRLIRLNSDGTKDTTFNIGTGFNNLQPNNAIPVGVIKVQSDLRVLVGGDFDDFQGVTRKALVRLNSDGSLNTAFSTNMGTGFTDTFNNIFAIDVQTNGNILVGGMFTTFQSVSKNRILRLNANGTIDTTFIVGSGFDDIVRSIKIQPDGKILVGGDFSTYQGNLSRGIIRLNTDGSPDTSFIVGTGFQTFGGGSVGKVYSMDLRPDGSIYVSGDFVLYKSVSRVRLAKLSSTGSLLS